MKTPFDSATRAQLLDRTWVENAICMMGLADNAGIYPEHLQRFAGGAQIWQYPCQLAPYLIWLSDKHIKTYCEIGIAYGGTLAATVAYLDRFTPIERVLTIDDNSMHLGGLAQRVLDDLPMDLVMVWGRSNTAEARRAVAEVMPDLVLIDAMHTADACQHDFDMVNEVAQFVALHDICEWSTPGVHEVWNGITGNKVEFIEQYKPGRMYFGLGVTW